MFEVQCKYRLDGNHGLLALHISYHLIHSVFHPFSHPPHSTFVPHQCTNLGLWSCGTAGERVRRPFDVQLGRTHTHQDRSLHDLPQSVCWKESALQCHCRPKGRRLLQPSIFSQWAYSLWSILHVTKKSRPDRRPKWRHRVQNLAYNLASDQ